jgi:hypothetical protein
MKTLIPGKITQCITKLGSLLLEMLCEDVQGHHEAVFIDIGDHKDYVPVNKAPGSQRMLTESVLFGWYGHCC